MKLPILSLFFLFLTANAGIIPLTNKLPIELIEAVYSVQLADLDTKEKTELYDLLKSLDRSFKEMDKGDLYFLSKSEVYKTILKEKKGNDLRVDLLNPAILSNLQRSINSFKETSPFGHWLSNAIYADLKLIFENPNFPQQANILRGGGKQDANLARVKKKIILLTPWFLFLTSTSAKDINNQLRNVILKYLDSLDKKSKQHILLAKGVVHRGKSSKQLSFFQYGDIKVGKKVFSSVSSILDSVIEKHEKAGIPVPVNEWTPSEDDFAKMRSQIDIPKVDPKYKKPNSLPIPTDDWILEL